MVIITVNLQEAKKLIQQYKNNSDFVILDVRTSAEFTKGRLRGAVNINIYDDLFKKNLESLDRKKTYLVYCHAGVRSSMAVEIMQKRGFAKIYNLNGDIFE